MFRKKLALIVIVCMFWASNLQAEQIHSTWVGGESGLWEDENNWDPPIIPDNNPTMSQTFAVTISGDVKVGRLWENYVTIDQLDCYGNVILENWNPDTLTPVVLTLEGPNGLRNHGNLSIRIGIQMQINGKLDNPEGCAIEADRNVDIEAGELENGGFITIPPMTTLSVSHQLHNVGQISIYGGQCIGNEVFDNDSTGHIVGFGMVYAPSLANEGVIWAYGGPLTVVTGDSITNTGIISNWPLASINVIESCVLSPAVKNNGVIEVNPVGVSFDRYLSNEPNGVIKLRGGTLAALMIYQKAGATLEGFGGITSYNRVVIEPNGIIKLTGPTNIVGGVAIDLNATLEVSDGLTLITGKTDCNDGTIYMKGGYVIPQGGLSGNCNIIWEPGLYTNVADFNLDGQVNLKDFAYFADTWLWQTAWR